MINKFDKDAVMPYAKFRRIAPRMSFDMFKKLRNGHYTFEQFMCRVFNPKEEPDYLCIDDLKLKMDEQYFEDQSINQEMLEKVI